MYISICKKKIALRSTSSFGMDHSYSKMYYTSCLPVLREFVGEIKLEILLGT